MASDDVIPTLTLNLRILQVRVVIAAIFGLVLAGCDTGSKAAMALISKRNVVVLASRGVDLSDKSVDLRPPKPMEITGSLSSICFVLKDGVAMQDANALERTFAESLGKARISTTLVLSNGDRVALARPSVSWSEEGTVLKSGELAACAAPPCGVTLPVGAAISKVEASSEPAFSVKGIYWKSERDPSEPRLPAVTSKNAQVASNNGCPAAR